MERHSAPGPWQAMGRCYREMGLVDSALFAYEQSLRVDSAHIPAYVGLTQLLDDEGEYERAVEVAESGHSRAPENLELRYLLGSMLVRTGAPERAVPHLEAVVEAWPWHHSTLYNLGRALVLTGREGPGREYLDRAEELRRLDSQIEQAERATETRPDDPAAFVELAMLMRKAGRYDEALHAYRLALQLDPGNPDLVNNISGLHMLRGESDLAVRLLRQIVRRYPNYVDGWLNLGVTYAQLDSPAAARDAWQKVLRLDPDNEVASGYLSRLESL